MALRKWMLWVVLGSVGAAAVLGVLAVLLGGGEVVDQFIGTAVVTVLASLGVLYMAKYLEKPQTRTAGMVGIGGVLLEFLLCNAAIWIQNRGSAGWRMAEAFWASILTLALVIGIAVYLLKRIQEPAHRVASRTGMWVCGVFLVVAMSAIWLPLGYSNNYYTYGSWRYKLSECLWMSAWFVFLAGAVIWASLVGHGVDTGRGWRWVGVFGALGTFGFALWLTWHSRWSRSESIVAHVGFAGLGSAAILVGLGNLVLRAAVRSGLGWLKPVTLVCAALMLGAIDVAVVFEHELGSDVEEALARLAGAFGILTGAGSLALVVISGLTKATAEQPYAGQIKVVTLVCPHCQKKQEVGLGDGACGGCGLRIYIEVRDPKCPACEYLLYKIASDHCPECGAEIPWLANKGAVKTVELEPVESA